MNKEDLLKERYKVVADYPGNKFAIGDIITYVRKVAQTYDMWRNQNGVEIMYSSFHKYPHLFKKLEWYDEIGVQTVSKWIPEALQWAKEALSFASDHINIPESLTEHWGNMYLNSLHAIDQALDESASPESGREESEKLRG